MSKSTETVGRHPAFLDLLELADRCAGCDYPVVIQGESGTGKELLARRIHEGSARKRGPFCVVDCAVLNQSLAAAELFGHRRGAFTGAHLEHTGLVASASDGTLFLDEIGELDAAVQGQLLRLLQEGVYRQVGDTGWREANVRIVCATNRDLRAEVEYGRFRHDLYHRLDVLRLSVPPLRQRRSDIPLLARYFAESENRRQEPPRRLSNGAVAALVDYDWPGNVRELENVIRRLLLVCEGDWIGPEAVDQELYGRSDRPRLHDLPYKEARAASQDAFARRYLETALARADGNVTLAARQSGLRRQYFQDRLSDLGIRADQYRAQRTGRTP